MKAIDIKEVGKAMFKENEQRYPFLITENIENILKSVERAVAGDSWIYISGDVGTGKSEVTKYLQGRWQREPEKYLVVAMKAWLRTGSRVSALMKWLIATIEPDMSIPGDIELRAERLKTLLMKCYRAKKKVVVMIDEAQDLSEQTFRELKKVHELSAFGVSHLFSIIMFAKESSRADGFLAGRELGFRIKRIPIIPLSDYEMLQFAEKRFGICLPSGAERRRVASYFTQMAHPSPLGVRHLCETIQDHPDFKGTMSLDIIQGALRRDRKTLMKKYRITLKDIQRKAKETYGMNIATSTISDVQSGKGHKYNDRTVDKLDQIERDLINKAKHYEQRAM